MFLLSKQTKHSLDPRKTNEQLKSTKQMKHYLDQILKKNYSTTFMIETNEAFFRSNIEEKIALIDKIPSLNSS